MSAQKLKPPSVVAYGVASSILFLCVYIPTVMAISNAQGAIALVFGPFFAACLGASVALTIKGGQLMRSVEKQDRSKGAAYILIGAVGIVWIISGFASGVYQATHPT